MKTNFLIAVALLAFMASFIHADSCYKLGDKLEFCSYVDWPIIWNSQISPYQQDSLLEEQFNLLKDGDLKNAPNVCYDSYKNYLCMQTFRQCSSVADIDIPCRSYCIDAQEDCGTYAGGLGCDTTTEWSSSDSCFKPSNATTIFAGYS